MEFYRVLKNRKLIFLLFLLFVLNIFLFFQEQLKNGKLSDLIEQKEYRLTLLDRVSVFEDLESVEQWAGSLYSENQNEENVIWEIQSKIAYISGYQNNVETIISNADSMIYLTQFNDKKDNYTIDNIEKTSAAYKKLQGLSPEIGNDLAIVCFLSYHKDIWIVLIILLMLSLRIMSTEKGILKKILFATEKGRGKLACRKLLLLAVLTAVAVLIDKGSILCASIYLYGGQIHWDRFIQSIYLFQDFVYPISILAAIFGILLCYILAFFVIMLLFCCLILLLQNEAGALFLCCVFGGIEYLCSKHILPQSRWKILKYCNFAEFLQPENYGYQYYNVNIFRHAINQTSLTLFTLAFTLVFLGIAFVMLYSHTRVRQSRENRILCMFQSLFAVVRKIQTRLGVLGMECYKIVFLRHGALIIILLIFINMQFHLDKSMEYSEEEQFLNEFYLEYTGELNQTVYDYVEQECQYIEDLQNYYEEMQKLYEKGEIDKEEFYIARKKIENAEGEIQGLPVIKEKIQRLEEMEQSDGIKGWLVNERSYEKMLGTDSLKEQMLQTIFILCTIIFLTAGNFAYENRNQMKVLLRSACQGRGKLLRKKRMAGMLVTGLVVTAYTLLNLVYIHKTYGLSGLLAPVQSVSILKNIPFHINIMTYLLITFVLKLLLYIWISDGILLLSVKLNMIMLMTGMAVVLVVPVIAAYFGMQSMIPFSIFSVAYFFNSLLLLEPAGYVIIKIILLITVAVINNIINIPKWCITVE